MALSFSMREPCLFLVLSALVVAPPGCGGDDAEEMNVLPTASADGSGGSGDDGVSATTPTSTDPTDPTVGVDETGTGGGASFPVTYRFDCIEIVAIGDGDMDGEPDGEAFQANVLQQAWSADIMGHKLNIMLTVLERDDAAGTAMIEIGSGVGTGDADLCTETTTQQPPRMAGYQAGVSEWGAGATCSAAATDGGVGTYTFALDPSEVVYVYAEDDDGTTFNCVPDGSAPDAVPVRAIEASVTIAAGESTGHGQLQGCLTRAEASALCSCLGECVGEPDPDCGGCPAGAHPLESLLGTIGPTTRCTELMGEEAFDLVIGFVTSEIPINPEVCG